MGLSFAKSIKVGAVRFNFSGSGIGVSAGIPGLRIGTGPRGAYISGGTGGFRYRQSLSAVRRQRAPTDEDLRGLEPGAQAAANAANIARSQAHDQLDVLELADASSDELLQAMNAQRAKEPGWLVAFGAGLLGLWVLAFYRPWLEVGIAAGALALLVAWLHWRDRIRRLTVLFYNPDTALNDRFQALCHGTQGTASTHKLRSITTTSQYIDSKYEAGASQGMQFAAARFALGQAPGVVANVDVPLVVSGKTTLAFYPDRVLAFQGRRVGAVSYDSLDAQCHFLRFIEAEQLPHDARVIDRTWQYVNKNGGPDRRFKNNRELPVCAYSQLLLSSPEGLDLRFLGSKETCFDAFVNGIRQMNPAGHRKPLFET